LPLSGTDVAGEIVEIGQQVKDFKVGDKVLAKLTHQVIQFSLSFPPSLVSTANCNTIHLIKKEGILHFFFEPPPP